MHLQAVCLRMRFQFLMVRLKVSIAAHPGISAHPFQFLMVRLKGTRAMRLRTESRISIPYGSIKRFSEPRAILVVILFQFLMVRLKGCLISGQRKSISKFQFLMVRLKGRHLLCRDCHLQVFQFLMVRLKGCMRRT